MKRISMVELLQVIYVDICIYDKTVIAVCERTTNKIKYYYPKDLEEVMKVLETIIHPRYTKIILDSNICTRRILIKWIDEKYNYFNKKDNILFKEDTIFEMVEIEDFKRTPIDIVKAFEKRKIFIMKEVWEKCKKK